MATDSKRPGQKAKWRDSMKPANFSGIKDKIDQMSAHAGEYKNRSTGMYTVGVLMGRKGVDPDSLRTLDFREEVQLTGSRPSRGDIIAQYKTDFPQYAEISDNRIITLKSKPRVDFNAQGKMNHPAETKSFQTMIKEFVRGLKSIQQSTLTVKNIVDLVQNSTYVPFGSTSGRKDDDELNFRARQKQKQTPLLASILKTFITKPDQGEAIYPMMIVPSVKDLPQQYGTAVENAISIDFGEVIGPVALVTGNATGNASRLSREFLDAETSDLMKSATIHFNAGAGDPLYDSFIEYDGRVVGLSSKGHNGGGAASAGTSISSLATAIAEVKANPNAVKLLKKLLGDAENRRMFSAVSLIAQDAAHGLKWGKTLRMLQMLDPSYSSKDMYSDIRHIRSLGRGQTNNVGAGATRQFNSGLSEYLRGKIASAPGKKTSEVVAFERFLKVTNSDLTKSLNQNPKFSEICTWILNHSATVQVDLYTSRSGGGVGTLKEATVDYGGAVVMTNVVATWPSTRVDTVELLEDSKDLKFMLGINGYAQKFPDRAEMPWVDTDFKDSIKAKATDRDGSELKTAKDWRQQGVNGPRTTTDLHDLPANTAKFTPPVQPAATPKRAPKATQAITSGGPLTKMRQFVATTGIVRNENSPLSTPNKLIHFVEGILRGTAQFPANFETSFRTLLSDKSVLALVRQHTKKIKDHPTDIDSLYENLLGNQDLVVTIVATLYWAWMARVYHSRYPDKNYHQVALENVKRLLKELNVHRASHDEVNKHERTIDRFGIQ